jgi:cytochrome o ubiquinol oxidase subunit 2
MRFDNDATTRFNAKNATDAFEDQVARMSLDLCRRPHGSGDVLGDPLVIKASSTRLPPLLLLLALGGCQRGILDPAGPVGLGERVILLDSLAIMLAIVIPTIAVTAAFAWWFRSSNKRAVYRPDWSYSGRLELLVWSIPTLVVLFLGGIGWISSHDLDPAKPLVSNAKPIEVQVVSLDWKWLFIYPEEGVASVNHLVLPAGVPVHFQLTSATVMNSFFIPQLGSQIYTMSGMVTQVNLQADKPGHYAGLSAQFSGDGFSDMTFAVDALPVGEYEGWLLQARGAQPLDPNALAELEKPSTAVVPVTYKSVTPNLFESLVNTQMAPMQPAQAAGSGAKSDLPQHVSGS